jgi:serine/threonine-protein kinase
MEHIGPYQIESEIGRGGMGVVYRSTDPLIGRPVAIKTIRPADSADPAERVSLRARLLREAKSGGMLSHPGIVTVYQVGEEHGTVYIAMEFVEGASLAHLLADSTRIDRKVGLSYLRQTAAALDYAHSHGVVHRDVKPENLLVRPDGIVKIADFGIAKVAGSTTLTDTGTVLGTPHYMSPEQVQGMALDARSDQFSLGVIAYRVLAGVRPFDGETLSAVFFKILSAQPDFAWLTEQQLGAQVRSVLERALAKVPGARFETCSQFISALEAACSQPERSATTRSQTVAAKPKPRHTRAGIAAAVGLTAMVLSSMLCYSVLRQHSAPPQATAKPAIPPSSTAGSPLQNPAELTQKSPTENPPQKQPVSEIKTPAATAPPSQNNPLKLQAPSTELSRPSGLEKSAQSQPAESAKSTVDVHASGEVHTTANPPPPVDTSRKVQPSPEVLQRAPPIQRNEKRVKDQQEYDLYSAVTKETDNNKKLQLLNAWLERYPDSDFRQDRLVYFLNTYQQLGQAAKMIDTAKEILAIDPKDITALYWITFLSPSIGNNSPDALAAATKAANGLLAAEEPATIKDADWKAAETNFEAIAYKTLGWVAMVQKDNADAEKNFKQSLSINPNASEVSYWLGQVVLARSIAENRPELQSEALYNFARAAAYDGTGALNPAGRKVVDEYLTRAYATLHGGTSGLAELKAQAKANSQPPADFKIKTAAEIAAEK